MRERKMKERGHDENEARMTEGIKVRKIRNDRKQENHGENNINEVK